MLSILYSITNLLVNFQFLDLFILFKHSAPKSSNIIFEIRLYQLFGVTIFAMAKVLKYVKIQKVIKLRTYNYTSIKEQSIKKGRYIIVSSNLP